MGEVTQYFACSTSRLFNCDKILRRKRYLTGKSETIQRYRTRGFCVSIVSWPSRPSISITYNHFLCELKSIPEDVSGGQIKNTMERPKYNRQRNDDIYWHVFFCDEFLCFRRAVRPESPLQHSCPRKINQATMSWNLFLILNFLNNPIETDPSLCAANHSHHTSSTLSLGLPRQSSSENKTKSNQRENSYTATSTVRLHHGLSHLAYHPAFSRIPRFVPFHT